LFDPTLILVKAALSAVNDHGRLHAELPMSFPTVHIWGKSQTALAVAALVSWGAALWQAAPRLMAGPLCSSAQDMSVLAGHCPACPAALLVSLALLTSLALRWREARRMAPMRAIPAQSAG
jgi:hypothetical protein